MCDVHLAVNLFVEMATNLLEKCDTGDNFFILSEHVSQDPLENYFGQQRGRGGRCDYPTVQQCLQNAASIRLQVA